MIIMYLWSIMIMINIIFNLFILPGIYAGFCWLDVGDDKSRSFAIILLAGSVIERFIDRVKLWWLDISFDLLRDLLTPMSLLLNGLNSLSFKPVKSSSKLR